MPENGNVMLFTPVRISGLELPNRFVMPAMKSRLTSNNLYGRRAAAYYAERAKGGFGLIISEFLAVNPGGMGSAAEPQIWSDECIEGFRMVTDAVHAEGGRMFAQLHHAGLVSIINNANPYEKGPSATVENGVKVAEMTVDEIRAVIASFADAAVRAVGSGFDGIEIHAAHGYLLDQFLNRRLNKRIDDYGGSYQNRFRIVSEILNAIRGKVGDDVPIDLRINAVDGLMPDDSQVDDALLYARMAETCGFDAIHVSIFDPIRSYYERPGFNVDNVAKVRKAVHIPVIAVGRITSGALAERIISEGSADLVALGRESVADPHFPNKVREGRETAIFHCAGCMQRCNPQVGCELGDDGMSCIFNPFTGKEGVWHFEQAAKPKKIAVVGAGCAGLEAAWILARRGYHVSVYEKSDRPGGLLNFAGIADGKEAFHQEIVTLVEHCHQDGVVIHLNCDINAKTAALIDPDAWVIATGSAPIEPHINGLEGRSVLAQEVLAGRLTVNGGNIAVLGGGLVGMETAEWLANHGCHVTVVEMKDTIAAEMVPTVRAALMARIEGRGLVTLSPSTKVIEVSQEGELLCERHGTEVNLGTFDYYVLAFGYRSNPVGDWFKNREWHAIGDGARVSDAKHDIYFAAKFAINYERNPS